MTEAICLDANYLVALFHDGDIWHKEAARMQVAFAEGEVRLITPDCSVTEALTVSARRCLERRQPRLFTIVTQRVIEAIPADAITWVSPHLPRWFGQCVETMQKAAGALSFHDALLCVAAEEVGYRTIVSFDADFDRWGGLQRLGSLTAVKAWVRKQA